MDGGKVIYHFEADDSDLKDKTLSVGKLVKGNLISSAITSGISKVWGGIKKISSSITDMAVEGGFNRALNIEQAEFKLKGLGHSAEEVDKIMENALNSVKGTAYGLDEAATVAASAVAAGVQPGEDLERTLKLVGDAATISGRDMQSMGAIFNKVAAAGKMTGEELNQLTDSGIPMLQLLGDSLGKTNDEVREMVRNGEISFDDFRNAIEKGMGGAALTMGETFSGALANTKAAMSRLGKTFMDPFMKGMTPALGTLTSIIDDIAAGTTEGLEEKTKQLSTQLGEMFNNVLSTLVPLIQNAIPVISQVLTSLIEMIPSLLETLLPKLMEVIVQIINSIAQMLPTLMPILVNALVSGLKSLASVLPQIINAVIDAAVSLIDALADALPDLIPTIINALIDGLLSLLDNIDVIINAGIKLIMGLIQGIITAIPILVAKLPLIITSIIKGILGALPQLIMMAPQIIISIITGLINAIPMLIDMAPQIITGLIEGLAKGFENIVTTGKEILTNMWNGIKEAIPKLLEKIPEIPSKIIEGIKNGLSGIFDIGKNLIKGLWNGIKNAKEWVLEKIKGLGKAILKGIKGIFGIHSPSTEFEWIGKMNMVGFEQGMEGMKDQVQGTIDSMFNLQPNINGSMSSAYSPQMSIQVINNLETDPLGQLVNNVKTFSGGSKNDYNWGSGL